MSKIEEILEDVEDILEDKEEKETINDIDTMGKLKTAKTAVLIGAIAAALVVFSSVFVFDPFHLNLSFFAKKKLMIEKTNNVVSEIKKISEFTTACFYEEVVLQDHKYKYHNRPVYKKDEANTGIMNMLHINQKQDGVVRDSTMTDQIVLIVNGKVRAGYNLAKIEARDFVVSGDTLFVRTPEVEIFDVIVNPSDVESFYSRGSWQDHEVSAVISKAKNEIEKDAIENGILDKAASSGKEKMEQLFKAFGFSEVVIE